MICKRYWKDIFVCCFHWALASGNRPGNHNCFSRPRVTVATSVVKEEEKAPLLDPMALCFCSAPLQRLRRTNRNDLFLKGQSPRTKRSSSERRVPRSDKQTSHRSLGKHNIYNQNRISIFHIGVKPSEISGAITQEPTLESLCCTRCSAVWSQVSRSRGNLSGTTLLNDLSFSSQNAELGLSAVSQLWRYRTSKLTGFRLWNLSSYW